MHSLFFAGIMLGRSQIEFLFLFSIAPIVFATSVCNKQRQGTVDSSSSQAPTKMYTTGQKLGKKSDGSKFSTSDAFINVGASSLNNTVRKVMPPAAYNTSYYRKRNKM